MEMFLTIVLACFPVLVLSALALMRQESRTQSPPVVRLDHRDAMPAPRFFVNDRLGSGLSPRIPREVLLNQIQSHVRLEVAAAETFLDGPTVEALHARSASPLCN
jgi:hypothetical protein